MEPRKQHVAAPWRMFKKGVAKLAGTRLLHLTGILRLR